MQGDPSDVRGASAGAATGSHEWLMIRQASPVVDWTAAVWQPGPSPIVVLRSFSGITCDELELWQRSFTVTAQ